MDTSLDMDLPVRIKTYLRYSFSVFTFGVLSSCTSYENCVPLEYMDVPPELEELVLGKIVVGNKNGKAQYDPVKAAQQNSIEYYSCRAGFKVVAFPVPIRNDLLMLGHERVFHISNDMKVEADIW